MNEVDFRSSVKTNSDCGSNSSVHAWNTQLDYSGSFDPYQKNYLKKSIWKLPVLFILLISLYWVIPLFCLIQDFIISASGPSQKAHFLSNIFNYDH